jgi:hypothetical protein
MAVAAPPRFNVVAVVLKTFAVVAVEPATVTVPDPFRLRAVAFVPVIVGFPIVNVPVAAPMLRDVAALPTFKVVTVALKTLAVVDVVVIEGDAPFRLRLVAFVPVIVGFAMVRVPVAAPRLTVVAAPPTFRVVVVAFSRATVACELVIALKPVAKVEAAAPALIVVAAPPTFRVVVVVLKTLAVVDVVAITGLAPFRFSAVAFVPVMVTFPMAKVPVAAPRLRVVAAPPTFSVVATVLAKANVVEPTIKAASDEPSVTSAAPSVTVVPAAPVRESVRSVAAPDWTPADRS